MAMSPNPLSGEDDIQELGEINVTPFIDVILVLLIVFMIAAPISTVDVPVDLPASTAQPKPQSEKPVYVTIRADLTLAVGETATDPSGLAGEIEKITAGNRETRLFIRADKTVSYGNIMNLLNELRAIGYRKVAMVALEQPPAPRPADGKNP